MPVGVYNRTKIHKQNLSKALKGRKLSEEHCKNIASGLKGHPCWNTGRTTPLSVRKKMSNAHKGEKSYLWKGGITPINRAIRATLEYKLWRKAVFERDGYQCVIGGKEHGDKLNADHIKPFSQYPELRFAIDNGRTLCIECHKTTETYGGKIRATAVR